MSSSTEEGVDLVRYEEAFEMRLDLAVAGLSLARLAARFGVGENAMIDVISGRSVSMDLHRRVRDFLAAARAAAVDAYTMLLPKARHVYGTDAGRCLELPAPRTPHVTLRVFPKP